MKREDLRLYAVTDRSWLGEESLCSQVEKALRGGVSFVQLREKQLDDERFLAEARELRALCAKYGVPFVVNDRVDIALAVDADGVHVGQEDMAVKEARRLLGPGKIVGATCKSVEQALRAVEEGADYIGSGAMFPSTAKPEAQGISFDELRAICAASRIPVVAIGGITEANLPSLAGTGIAGAALVSAIFAQKDIEAAARRLRALTEHL
ncbi:MAG: thiamine phosphate synthase [Oscillospiraceae bacterium]|nr:thiamine phosphate synthase [Oscillospiraceae bacterium]